MLRRGQHQPPGCAAKSKGGGGHSGSKGGRQMQVQPYPKLSIPMQLARLAARTDGEYSYTARRDQ